MIRNLIVTRCLHLLRLDGSSSRRFDRVLCTAARRMAGLPVPPATISAEHSGIFSPTVNMMGWQQNYLDEYLTDFVDFAATNLYRPIGDLGAAYGYVSQKLLERGCTVIMNDLEPAHLEDIFGRVSADQQQRLTRIPGSMLDMKLKPESLDGVVAARVTQFFPVEDIRRFFEMTYAWLARGGRLCVTNTSPYRGTTPEFQKEYERKVTAGEEWPGVTTTDSLDQNRQKRINLAQTGYRFDPAVLTREAERVGFRVIRVSYYATPFLPDEFRSADRERDAVGLIAEK